MDLKTGRIRCVAAQPADLMLMLEVPYSYLEKLAEALSKCEINVDMSKEPEKELASWFTETAYPNLVSILEEFREE